MQLAAFTLKKAFLKNAGILSVVIILATAIFSPITACSQTLQTLHNHVPPAISRLRLQSTGDVPSTNHLQLAISLPLRNEPALDLLIQQIYDPKSPHYHQYLTPEQFTEQFGPSENDYQAAEDFFRSNGLTVTGESSNRLVLDVSGTAADVKRVFHVGLHTYRHPTENRTFFAPDADPAINLGVPVLHISGLDNYLIPHPALRIKSLANNQAPAVKAAFGSGPSGEYMGNDFRQAYLPGVTLDGTGQTVGLLELEGYFTNQINTYETTASLPNVPLTNIIVDSFPGVTKTDTNGVIEVHLDIEMAMSMATNLSAIAVFEEQNGGNVVDILNSIAAHSSIKQISSSWLIGDNAAYDTVYKTMASQGQSFFQASGDNGAFFTSNEANEQYTDDTNITLVGGTTLSTAGAGGAWSSETVWNWFSSGIGQAGSGGGTNFNGVHIPSWQQNVSMTNNQGSTTLRNIPDVALTADNIYVQAYGSSFYVGGTSAAAPLWAGFTALVNQQAVAANKPYVGFLNPAIYALGQGLDYTNDFHDIATGNNTNLTLGDRYFAVPGYDLCTGWGTPNGQNLINDLVPPDTLSITPQSGFSASGYAGGPFSPLSQVYALTNSSGASLTWSLINTSSWLNASSSGSTLPAGGTTSVTISLNSATNTLAVGTYSATLVFTNGTSHAVQNFQFNLQILEPLKVSPGNGFTATGFIGGPFSPSSQNYVLTNSSLAAVNWSIINTSSWLTVSSSSGTLSTHSTASTIISLAAADTSLAVGIYNTTVTFSNALTQFTTNLQFSLQISAGLVLTPATGFTSIGGAGGPFNTNSEIFSLTNIGSSVVNWQASGPFWLTVSPANGSLANGTPLTLTASLNSSANSLAAGVYASQLSVSDLLSGIVITRPITLSIGQNIVQNGGFETGSFSSWSLKENPVQSIVDNGSRTGLTPHSGTYFAAFGHRTTAGTLSQTLVTVPNQTYLLSLWFNSPDVSQIPLAAATINTPNQFGIAWNSTTLFSQVNIPPITGWTNMVFIVTATSSSTVLKFTARCDPWYLGLDDVSVAPLPTATITGTSRASAGAMSFTCNALSGLVYEVQCSTNLLSTNWVNLSTNTATGNTITITNSTMNNPFLFYRVIQLP